MEKSANEWRHSRVVEVGICFSWWELQKAERNWIFSRQWFAVSVEGMDGTWYTWRILYCHYFSFPAWSGINSIMLRAVAVILHIGWIQKLENGLSGANSQRFIHRIWREWMGISREDGNIVWTVGILRRRILNIARSVEIGSRIWFYPNYILDKHNK